MGFLTLQLVVLTGQIWSVVELGRNWLPGSHKIFTHSRVQNLFILGVQFERRKVDRNENLHKNL